MPIERTHSYCFTCDYEGCIRKTYTFGHNKDIAWENVRHDGWMVKNGKVLCPEHKEETVGASGMRYG